MTKHFVVVASRDTCDAVAEEFPSLQEAFLSGRRNMDEGAQVTILASDGQVLISYAGMIELCGLDDAASTGWIQVITERH
jgi:hypothetical protein